MNPVAKVVAAVVALIMLFAIPAAIGGVALLAGAPITFFWGIIAGFTVALAMGGVAQALRSAK